MTGKRNTFLRHTTVLFLLLAGGISMVLFSVKYQVHDLEDEHARLTRELQDERRALHVLRAEWATLNDPERIRALAEEHLGMTPVRPAQVVGVDGVQSIPVRALNVVPIDETDGAASAQDGEGRP